MAWAHSWGSPELLTIVGSGRRLMVPRQVCLVCGTARNPFNNVLTHFSRTSACRDLIVAPGPVDHSSDLRELEAMIDSLYRQGEPVDKWHTGRKRNTDVPELPLPYRD